MVYLVIFLALAMVLGPVLWIRPSPRAKQQERLRGVARSRGLHVHLRAVPNGVEGGERKVDANIMAYIRPWTETERKRVLPRNFIMSRDLKNGQWYLYRAHGSWQNEDVKPLPDSVSVIEVSGEGVIVYWRETGDESRVILLADTLERLAQQLIKAQSN